MAISKTQNERPAIIELIDTTDDLVVTSELHTQSIAALTDGLSDEIGAREAADTLLDVAIESEATARELAVQAEATAREQAVQAEATARIGADTTLTNSIGATNAQVFLLGNEQAALAEDVSGILELLESVKFGLTGEVTVQANYTYTASYAYPEPFDASAKCFVLLGFADELLQTTLSLSLVESTYSGFRYSVNNAGTDPATVTVGYLAIAVIPLS